MKSETAAELSAVHENQMKSFTEQHHRELEGMCVFVAHQQNDTLRFMYLYEIRFMFPSHRD